MCWQSSGAFGPSLHPRMQNSLYATKFVHSCSCCVCPNALENTSPPIGLPAARQRAPRHGQGRGARTVAVRAVGVQLAALVAAAPQADTSAEAASSSMPT